MQKRLSVVIATGDMFSELLRNYVSLQIRVCVPYITPLTTMKKDNARYFDYHLLTLQTFTDFICRF